MMDWCCWMTASEGDPAWQLMLSESVHGFTAWMLVIPPRWKLGFSSSAKRLGAQPTGLLSTSPPSGEAREGMLLLAVLLPLLLCAPRSRKRAKKFSLSAPLVRASNEPWLPKSRRLLPLLMAKVAGLPVLFSRTLLLPPPPPTPTTPPPLLLFVLPGV